MGTFAGRFALSRDPLTLRAGFQLSRRVCFSLCLFPLLFMTICGCGSALHPLHAAVKKGDLAEVTRLLQEGKDINEKDGPGGTPLHYAALYDFDGIATFLIEHGANVNSRAAINFETPLHLAAGARSGRVLDILIAKGADVNAVTRGEKTALDYAQGTLLNRVWGIQAGPPKSSIVEVLRKAASDSKPAESKPVPPAKALRAPEPAVPPTEVPRAPEPAHESDVQSTAGDAENARVVDVGRFQFRVPATWTRASASEEAELKRSMLAGARQMLDTQKGSVEIEQFYMFKTPEDAMVLVCDLPIPAEMPAHEYMTKLKAMNETKFEYGRQAGIVKRVIKIELTETKESSVLETEYIAVEGTSNRTLVYNVARGPAPKFSVGITAFFRENDDHFKESVKKVMASVGFGKTP